MQSVLGGAVQSATHALSSDDKKIADLKKDFVRQTEKTKLSSEFGVKQPNNDNSLSATTADRQGPVLLEDTWGREKVR